MLRIYFYGLTLEFSSVYDEFMPGGSFTCPVCALLGVCILFMPCKRSLPPRVHCQVYFIHASEACCEVGSPGIYAHPYISLGGY